MRELPITLPSLNIAVLKIPTPMTEMDFDTLVNSLKTWKAALVPPAKDERPRLDMKKYHEQEADEDDSSEDDGP